jgi:hypothetical protein
LAFVSGLIRLLVGVLRRPERAPQPHRRLRTSSWYHVGDEAGAYHGGVHSEAGTAVFRQRL